MYLCVVSLSSHDWSAHQQLGVLQNVGQGECVWQTTRERERESERGNESLPVTRKSNKGKKSSISPAKCTPGRRKGERESKKERKVMN